MFVREDTYVESISTGSVRSELTDPVNKHLHILPVKNQHSNAK